MFTKKQQSELITSIEGRGEIPLKFVYLGKGAKKWDDLASLRKNRGINEIEGDLLQAKSGNFLSTWRMPMPIAPVPIIIIRIFTCFSAKAFKFW